jgi:hypothetical protein
MAVQFRRNPIRGLACPAFHHPAGVSNPISGACRLRASLRTARPSRSSYAALALTCLGISLLLPLTNPSTSCCSPFEKWSTRESRYRYSVVLVYRTMNKYRRKRKHHMNGKGTISAFQEADWSASFSHHSQQSRRMIGIIGEHEQTAQHAQREQERTLVNGTTTRLLLRGRIV